MANLYRKSGVLISMALVICEKTVVTTYSAISEVVKTRVIIVSFVAFKSLLSEPCDRRNPVFADISITVIAPVLDSPSELLANIVQGNLALHVQVDVKSFDVAIFLESANNICT
jgi:hypothetical protein